MAVGRVFYKGRRNNSSRAKSLLQMLFEMKVRHRLAISECVEFGIARFDGHLDASGMSIPNKS
jgi:hypothetical protein